jgi:hypothetical protein
MPLSRLDGLPVGCGMISVLECTDTIDTVPLVTRESINFDAAAGEMRVVTGSCVNVVATASGRVTVSVTVVTNPGEVHVEAPTLGSVELELGAWPAEMIPP